MFTLCWWLICSLSSSNSWLPGNPSDPSASTAAINCRWTCSQNEKQTKSAKNLQHTYMYIICIIKLSLNLYCTYSVLYISSNRGCITRTTDQYICISSDGGGKVCVVVQSQAIMEILVPWKRTSWKVRGHGHCLSSQHS